MIWEGVGFLLQNFLLRQWDIFTIYLNILTPSETFSSVIKQKRMLICGHFRVLGNLARTGEWKGGLFAESAWTLQIAACWFKGNNLETVSHIIDINGDCLGGGTM